MASLPSPPRRAHGDETAIAAHAGWAAQAPRPGLAPRRPWNRHGPGRPLLSGSATGDRIRRWDTSGQPGGRQSAPETLDRCWLSNPPLHGGGCSSDSSLNRGSRPPSDRRMLIPPLALALGALGLLARGHRRVVLALALAAPILSVLALAAQYLPGGLESCTSSTSGPTVCHAEPAVSGWSGPLPFAIAIALIALSLGPLATVRTGHWWPAAASAGLQ